MTSWERLLDIVAAEPRENGSAGLDRAVAALAQLLRSLGFEPQLVAWTAHPYRLRLAGVVVLLGCIAYAVALQRRRPGLAAGLALATPLLLLVELDFYQPIFGWLGAAEQQHVEVVLEPPRVEQHILVAAHLDTKTDLVDHVVRAPIELLGLPLALLMLAAAAYGWRHRQAPRGRLERSAIVASVLYGVASCGTLAGGALVRDRSPGVLDDGAACAVLVRLGEALRAAPLAKTRVTLLFLTGEEIGVQGSWDYASRRFAVPPELPTAVVNLEFLGASKEFATFKGERFASGGYPPSARLLEVFEAVHQEELGAPLYVTWYSAATDARSFLAHGIPAMTLLNVLPDRALPRHMHSAADDRSRLVPGGLDAAQQILEAALRRMDHEGLG